MTYQCQQKWLRCDSSTSLKDTTECYPSILFRLTLLSFQNCPTSPPRPSDQGQWQQLREDRGSLQWMELVAQHQLVHELKEESVRILLETMSRTTLRKCREKRPPTRKGRSEPGVIGVKNKSIRNSLLHRLEARKRIMMYLFE